MGEALSQTSAPDRSPATARQIPPTALLALAGVATVGLVLALVCTNHGVGLPTGSLPLFQAISNHHVWPAAPLYSLGLATLTSAKHNPAEAARVPQAILLALSTLIGGWSVWRSRGGTAMGAVLTAALLIVVTAVLHAATIVRPELLLTFLALLTLACAAEFGRTMRPGWLVATVLVGLATAGCGIGGVLIIPAALVAGVGASRGRAVLGHLAFALLYAISIALVTRHGPKAAWLFSPAFAALIVCFGVVASAAGRTGTAALGVAIGACLAITVSFVVQATRDGHDFASVTWKHSATMRSIAHLPRGSVYYSNAPEAIALHDRHPVRSVPQDGDDHGWEDLTQTLKNQESFVVWFNAAGAGGGALESIQQHVPLECYESTADGALYRADASAWTGGRRRIAFNPDTPAIASRRSAGKFEWWNQKHAEYVQQAAKDGIDLLFLGDSITDDYRKIPGAWAFFEERYGRYHPANFGIDGDRTQHLLFRILNGECDHIAPKVAVILIGTNNTGEDSPEAIAKGIKACVDATRQKLPTTRVLLLGLFPRGGSPENNDKRKIILRVNQLIAPLDNGDSVRFLNLYDKFLEADGTLSKDVMYDSLHPSLSGYHIWADAMQPLLDEMMRAPTLKPRPTPPTTRSK